MTIMTSQNDQWKMALVLYWKQELRSIEGNETKDTVMAIIYKATATKNTLDAAKNEVNV
jgi:hypothetical protein